MPKRDWHTDRLLRRMRWLGSMLTVAYLQYSRFSRARSEWDRPSWFSVVTGSRLWSHWWRCRCTPANTASSPSRWRWSSDWRRRKPLRWPAAFEPHGHTKPWRFILFHRRVQITHTLVRESQGADPLVMLAERIHFALCYSLFSLRCIV